MQTCTVFLWGCAEKQIVLHANFVPLTEMYNNIYAIFGGLNGAEIASHSLAQILEACKAATTTVL
jgi:hypothetical protein